MKAFSVAVVSVLLIVGGVLGTNYLFLGLPLNQVLEDDFRNNGIKVSATFANFIDPSALVIDIEDVSGEIAPIDIFRVFLQLAEKLEEREFSAVHLSSKGSRKFFIEGSYFQELGQEYDYQNPVYTMRTFPEHVYLPNGERAFGTWTGGFLGVTTKQLQDFSEFNRQWYMEDIE